MAKKIDYNKIKKEAEKANLSPYLLVKREINYRKKDNYHFECCNNCSYNIFTKYSQQEYSLQCHIIGVCNDFHAFVESDYVCDWHKR